jgi:hypothetical protein
MSSEHFTMRIKEPLRQAARARLHNESRLVTDDLGRTRRLTLSYIATRALEEYVEHGTIPGQRSSDEAMPNEEPGKAA